MKRLLGSMLHNKGQMILVFVLLGGFSVPGLQQASGVIIYTAAEVEAVNGTDVRLMCLFMSRYPVSLSSVFVSWSFRPQHGSREESAFLFYGEPFPPTEGRFKGHVVWSGDVMERDASITLKQVSQAHNGTYACRVKHGTDVHGRDAEVVLRVVDKSRFDTTDWLSSLFNGTGAGL